MANWEYRASYFNMSWSAPFAIKGRKLNGSLSLRRTVDRQKSDFQPQAGERDEYRHAPLCDPESEIRLFHLNPGTHDSELSGSFSVVDIDATVVKGEDTAYDALSYVWGTGDDNCQAVLNVEGSCIKLRPNLYDALRAIRSTSTMRTIWIDAICIEQSDYQEKAHQVSRMDDIYRKALQVLVWLGPGTPESAIGMQLLFHSMKGYSASRKFWIALEPDLLRSAVEGVLNRSYFSRMWVVQEAALAAKVVLVCGDDHISWNSNISTVFRFLQSLKLTSIALDWPHRLSLEPIIELLEKQLESGPDAVLWAGRKQRGVDVLSVAYSLRNRYVSDPRDKIFALLGLLSKDFSQKILPDYSKSAEEIFQRFAEIIEESSIDIFTKQIPRSNKRLEDAEDPAVNHVAETRAREVTAQSICLDAVQLMNSGELGEASRLLGRAMIMLNSDLHSKRVIEASK